MNRLSSDATMRLSWRTYVCGMVICLALPLLVGCGDQVDAILCALEGGSYHYRSAPWDTSGHGGGWCEYTKSKTIAVAPGTVLFLGATAHVAGANGTNWRSDVEVHSLGDETAEFVVYLLEHAADNSLPLHRELTLAPGQSLRLQDVLAGEFTFEGQAALAIMPTAGRVTLASRTYNLLGAGNDLGLPAGSTFGQYIPALTQNTSLGPGEEGRIIQLSHSRSSAGGFRTNLALVNATTEECRIVTDLFSADGTDLGRVVTVLAPLEYRQINRVFERVTAGDVGDGYAVVRTTSESGGFFAFASVVDNLTGDPVAIGAVRTGDVVPEDPVYVLASAHVQGAAGTNWRTDVEVHNPEAQTVSYTVDLLVHGADNGDPVSQSFSLGAGMSVRFEDVLEGVFGLEGQAALRFTATNGRVIVNSRTYNLLGSGNDLGLPAGATFGQFIPGVAASEKIGFGGEGRLIQLSHNPAGGGFRTNLILVNAGDDPIDIDSELFESNGSHLGTLTRTLAPFEYRQVNRIFEQVTGGSVADGYVVVSTPTDEGRFFALASVVDNLTGDPVGMIAAETLPQVAAAVVDEIEGALGGLAGTGIETLVNGLQGLGLGTVLDGLAALDPDVVSRTSEGLRYDYGSGTVMADGSVSSGTVTVDASGLSVGPQTISGVVSVLVDDLLVDGEPPAIRSTRIQVDLAERNNGTVHGDITINPEGGGKSAGEVNGWVTIDTQICPDFPIDGSVTIDLGDVVLTITFSPDCDGIIDHDLAPSSVFSYSYASPAGPNALDYVVGSSNAEVAKEGPVWYWRPAVGGETLAATTPGVITYHFPLAGPAVSGRLRAGLACWHHSFSQGHSFLYGSADGVSWHLMDEVSAPAEIGHANSGGWNGDLPGYLIGSTDIWLRVELNSFGPNASIGGIWVNTAQHSRWGEGSSGSTFDLEVTLGS